MFYILVTGGVISGLGKGVCSASIGVLLQRAGFHVTMIKIDPYLNLDAGNLGPYEHGEVFVLRDGSQVDTDFGTYERMLQISLKNCHSITFGKLLSELMSQERKGQFLGQTVQFQPHLSNLLIEKVEVAAREKIEGKEPNVCIIELGGTSGSDLESAPFLAAFRTLRTRVINSGDKEKKDRFSHVHVTLVLTSSTTGEPKTKAAQKSIYDVTAAGLVPDIVICRSQHVLEESVLSKVVGGIELNLNKVFCVPDQKSIYDVANVLGDKGRFRRALLFPTLSNRFPFSKLSLSPLTKPPPREKERKREEIRIAIVGKYVSHRDAYTSLYYALQSAETASSNQYRIKIDWIDAETDRLEEHLAQADALLIPGGFGSRGTEGMLRAIRYAREKRVPFLGICLGMQLAVIEYCRNVLEQKTSTSREFMPRDAGPIVDYCYKENKLYTGSGEIRLRKDTLAHRIYGGLDVISERFRHRYGIQSHRLPPSGIKMSGARFPTLADIIELDNSIHPFFIGVQFHPEFESMPGKPGPVFLALWCAAQEYHFSEREYHV